MLVCPLTCVVCSSELLNTVTMWHCRQSPAPVSNRDPYGNASLSSSSNSGSCKGSDGSPTHRRHMKYTSCTDNHGIKPPPPEQYLTPLQQKEVCIRHLRARLKDTIERLQDRDTEIDELRTQLSRMQEDWIEEECHRVEAQLALKEARREIQQLKQVIDVVRSSLGETDTGVQKCFQDINLQNHRLETLLQSAELAQCGAAKEGPAGSCVGSPAHSLTRSSTYTKLSDQAAATEQEVEGSISGSDVPCLSGEGTQDSGFVCCGEVGGPSARAELLLEAACLQEEAASLLSACSRLPHSATCEALGYGEPRRPPLLSAPAHGLASVETASASMTNVAIPPTDPSEIAPSPDQQPSPAPAQCLPLAEETGEPAPLTAQAQNSASQAEQAGTGGVTVVEVDEDEDDEEAATGVKDSSASVCGVPVKSYWSRHFLVDLLAVAVPVVPTLAWLCRGPCRGGQPMYHFGSLLRGCCTVALHSLRRGGGLRHYPAGGGGPGGMSI
uniref:Syntaphilin b n=1 Tax=Electrophorus electricus TaxID=8005 RepID=A0A4W4EQG4_ELEEL